jgi:LPS export ABC transporter protein LptC
MHTTLPNIYRRRSSLRGSFAVVLLSTCFLWLCSCEKNNKKLGALYEGPTEIVNNVQIRYSEQGLPKVQMVTPLSMTYSNQNKIFPDTVNINFFDPTGAVITHLRADSGRFDHASNVYIVKGHVKVIKSQTEETLTTSELSWSPVTKKVFTDKALTVRNTRTSEVTNAIGMDAEQDFTRIKFRKATGIYKFSGLPRDTIPNR